MGRKTLYEKANIRVREMMANHYPEYIDPAADARIRKHFPIRLEQKDMRPDNGRW
jgi:trimethylamine--corrinoid protein Co-methyltransferase